jgi:addiction module RelE/StbE family toxin
MRPIRWTETAVRDLTRVCDYIEQRYGSAHARSVALKIYEATEALGQFPYRGRAGRKSGTRELVTTDLPYLIVYRVREEIIEITRILHGAQKWP